MGIELGGDVNRAISARSSTCSGSSGGKQMHSVSTIAFRFHCSSLLGLVFNVISMLQSFEPLLQVGYFKKARSNDTPR
jgi:hypothetical protein